VAEKQRFNINKAPPVVRIIHGSEWEDERHSLLFVKPLIERILVQLLQLRHDKPEA